MDPETAKLLDKALPVAGTLLGAMVGVIGAWLVAKTNIAGQREIARDAARRARRERQVGELLGHVDRAVSLLPEMAAAIRTGEAVPLERYFERYMEVAPPKDVARWEPADSEFRAKTREFFALRIELERVIERNVGQAHGASAEDRESCVCLARELVTKAGEVHRAASLYLDKL